MEKSMSTPAEPMPAVGSPEWQALMAAARRDLDLKQVEALASPAALETYNALLAAQKTLAEAEAAEQALRKAHGDTIAEALGIRPGVIVNKERRKGWDGDTRTIRYVVTSWRLSGAAGLNLFGRTIRKDGTPGEICEIGSYWGKESEG